MRPALYPEQKRLIPRKYGEKAQRTVKEAMREFKHGKLKSGKRASRQVTVQPNQYLSAEPADEVDARENNLNLRAEALEDRSDDWGRPSPPGS